MTCAHCKKEVEHGIANSRHVLRDGTISTSWWCRPCVNERTKRRYHENKRRGSALIYTSIARQPEKQRARANLAYHIKSGHIVRPEQCERCGTKGKPHGHHPDYTKPLEVMWLCRGCHADVHRELREKA